MTRYWEEEDMSYYVCDHCGEEWAGDRLPSSWGAVHADPEEMRLPGLDDPVTVFRDVRHYCPECVAEGRADNG